MDIKAHLWIWIALSAFFVSATIAHPPSARFHCDNGKILFQSDATLEVIRAESRKLQGAIDPATNAFAWSVEVITFEGFNSPLQREHFNENYLESTRYPYATFTGKIIEKVDFQVNGTYEIRAKGKLMIHGVEQERIIKSTVQVKGKKLIIRSSFTVPLTDHDINIPKIVHQKIAEEVKLTLEAEMEFEH